MTKKEKILFKALELFAKEGYDAVSTQRIAESAAVSEGLIFKHFKSKRGLLEKIMEQAEKKISELFHHVLREECPEEVLRKMIDIVFKVEVDAYDFWRLQYKLKWEKEYNNPQKMKPVREKLCWAFIELGYSIPELEADLLLKIVDATAISILQNVEEDQDKLQSFLKQKYKVDE